MAVSKEDVLKFHSHGKAGKIEIALTKKIENAQDLSTAYSPGVAFPCLEIQKDPSLKSYADNDLELSILR